MKNFFILLSLIVCFALVLFSCGDLFGLFPPKASEEAYTLDLGFAVENCEYENAKTYTINDEVVGQVVYLKGDESTLNQIAKKLGLFVTKKYYVGQILMVEGVSSLLRFKIDGKQENVQIAFSDEKITIGSPIIYGAY